MKVTFNKLAVVFAFLMIIGYTALCIFTGNFPPDMMTACWYATWLGELVILAVIHENGKKETVLDKAASYINEDNAEAIIEKVTGVDLKRKK